MALAVVVAYWFLRAIAGSLEEHEWSEKNAASIAQLISAWGATLQVAVLSLVLIQPILLPVVSFTFAGRPLVEVLHAIRWTSPWSWLPMGLLLLGLVLHTALLFKSDPYIPKDRNEILNFETPLLLTPLVSILRFPTWLCINIAGFISHFVRLFWGSFGIFFHQWVGRIVLILLGLIVPTLLLVAAHWSVLVAMSYTTVYLSPNGDGLGNSIATFIAVHALVVLGMCLFIVGPVLLALEINPVSIQRVPNLMKSFSKTVWAPAVNSIGRTFSLYGSLVLAVPLAALLPGGSSFGIFSLSYTLMIVVALVVCWFKK